MTIPEAWLADCRTPEWGGGTYKDLAKLAEERRAALEECNLRLDKARREQQRQVDGLTGGD